MPVNQLYIVFSSEGDLAILDMEEIQTLLCFKLSDVIRAGECNYENDCLWETSTEKSYERMLVYLDNLVKEGEAHKWDMTTLSEE